MPIFEYKCKKCGEVFEVLVRGDEKPKCPSCKSARLEKLVSSFSASTSAYCDGSDSCAGGRKKSGGCCCGGGHCSHG